MSATNRFKLFLDGTQITDYGKGDIFNIGTQNEIYHTSSGAKNSVIKADTSSLEIKATVTILFGGSDYDFFVAHTNGKWYRGSTVRQTELENDDVKEYTSTFSWCVNMTPRHNENRDNGDSEFVNIPLTIRYDEITEKRTK